MSTESKDPATPEVPKISHRDQRRIKDLEEQVAELKALAREAKDLVKPAEAAPSPEAAPREAVYVELHNQIFLPGLGQLPKSMDASPSSQQPKLRGLKMIATPYGVEVDLRSRVGFIPWGNIAWCVFKLIGKEAAKEADKHVSTAVAPGYTGPSKLGTATVTQK